MLRPALTVLLLAASLPVAAESLNYNIVEFSESANMEVPRDTMTAYFSVNAEGKDRQAVNQAFMKKFNQFNKISQNSKFKAELMERNASPRYQYTNGKRTRRNRRPTEQGRHPALQRPRPKSRPNARLLQLQNR